MQAHVAGIPVEEATSVFVPVAAIAAGIAMAWVREGAERWRRHRPRSPRPLGGRRSW